MDAIVTYDLAKQYGSTWALRGLNLQVPQGSAVACVGRENSGKTTLIRLLSGLYRPTSGECTVLGLSPAFETERLHALVGTVLGTARLYGHLTLQENLNFFAGLHQVDSNDGVERSSFLLHALDIWEARDLKVRELPTGVLRRAALAQALMHRPSVLLLDLPPQGLDPESQEADPPAPGPDHGAGGHHPAALHPEHGLRPGGVQRLRPAEGRRPPGQGGFGEPAPGGRTEVPGGPAAERR